MARNRLSPVITRLLESAQAVEDSITVHGPLITPILDELFLSPSSC